MPSIQCEPIYSAIRFSWLFGVLCLFGVRCGQVMCLAGPPIGDSQGSECDLGEVIRAEWVFIAVDVVSVPGYFGQEQGDTVVAEVRWIGCAISEGQVMEFTSFGHVYSNSMCTSSW